MPTSYKFSEAEKAELEAARRKNKNKSIERRLKALLLRAQGVKRAEVALETGMATSYVSERRNTANMVSKPSQEITTRETGAT